MIRKAKSRRFRSQVESLEGRTLFAAAGDLDVSFSGDGHVAISDVSATREAHDVEALSGGKTLITGISEGLFFVQRLKADGTPDTSFGTSGEGRTIVPNAGVGQSIEVRADGKIVVAASYTDPADINATASIKLIRLNSNGTIDTSFGGGDGIVDVATPFAGGHAPVGLEVLSNNKMIFAVSDTEEATVARFNSDGTPDSTFGGDGFASIDAGFAEKISAIAVASDGSVFAGGFASAAGPSNPEFPNYRSTLVKFKADGSGVDSNFGMGGILGFSFHSTDHNPGGGTSLAFATNGKLLFAGVGGGGIVVSRIDPNTGAEDASFGTIRGQVVLQGTPDTRVALAVQSNGRIIVASGPSNQEAGDANFNVARLTESGGIDQSWGNGGRATVDFYKGPDLLQAVAIQSDGKVVAVGTTVSPTDPSRYMNAAVARLTSGGTLDTTFSGGDGKYGADFPGSQIDPASVVVQSDGKTIVGSTITRANAASPSGISSDFFLARYNVDGTLDSTFGSGGFVFRDVFTGQFDVLTDLVIQPNGRILALGSTAGFGRESDVALVRFNSNGTLDTSFGGGKGKVSVGLNGNDVGVEMGVRADGKILVSAKTNAPGRKDALIRFNADGTLDKTYDSDGILYHTYGEQIAITADSKTLIAGGNGYDDVIVTRLNSNGTIDKTYGVNGSTTSTGFGDEDSVSVKDLAIQNGKAVVLAEVYPDNFIGGLEPVVGLFRYTSSGSLDTSFGPGHSGKQLEYPPLDVTEHFAPTALAVDGQNRLIVIIASDRPGDDFPQADLSVLRLQPDGQRDTSFGDNGRASTAFGPNESAQPRDVAVAPNGRIVVLTGEDGYGLTRFLSTATTPPASTPALSIADASTSEGNSGTKMLNVTISLSSASTTAVTVKYRTKNGTAGDGDYGVVTSGMLTFAPGQTSKTISIVIKGDTKIESDETFRIELFDNLNATLADGVSVCTIKNDD